MSTLDSNGIMFLEETDPISPFQTLINGLQAATSAVVGDLQDQIDNVIKIQTGQVDVALNNNSTAYTDITFPEPFDEMPTVVVWNNHSNTSPRVVSHVWGISSTGARIGMYTADGSNHPGTRSIGWLAVVHQ